MTETFYVALRPPGKPTIVIVDLDDRQRATSVLVEPDVVYRWAQHCRGSYVDLGAHDLYAMGWQTSAPARPSARHTMRLVRVRIDPFEIIGDRHMEKLLHRSIDSAIEMLAGVATHRDRVPLDVALKDRWLPIDDAVRAETVLAEL